MAIYNETILLAIVILMAYTFLYKWSKYYAGGMILLGSLIYLLREPSSPYIWLIATMGLFMILTPKDKKT